ncbi:6179_t:CDS:2 [Dentiscutata erythropus]|uniref:6179_t:CDS:1 n=1 Tax=Dentiscutata erythropus TaxID=1348616 RepID=A0A9N9NNQ4_9GLOM|nr:6179_t:CDS:2 [Dentiscutata erythropus]
MMILKASKMMTTNTLVKASKTTTLKTPKTTSIKASKDDNEFVLVKAPTTTTQSDLPIVPVNFQKRRHQNTLGKAEGSKSDEITPKMMTNSY